MSTLIILTSNQASTVRGASNITPTSYLEPIALTDGHYVLGIETIDDPAHVQHKVLLSSLPQVDYSTIASLLPSQNQ